MTNKSWNRHHPPEADRADERSSARPRCLSGRQACIVLVAVLMSTQTGCSVWQLARRTMFCELNEYPQVTDARLSNQQYQRWAKQEWHRICETEGGGTYSSDYGNGFIQGFVDLVSAGGSASPPPIPPRKYWRIGYRNARGQRAIEEWYQGFEHGARVAEEGGYRDRAIIPSSVLTGIPGSQTDAEIRRSRGSRASSSNNRVIDRQNAGDQIDEEVLPEPISDELTPPPTPIGPVPDLGQLEAWEEDEGDEGRLFDEPELLAEDETVNPTVRPIQFELPGEDIELEPDETDIPPTPPWQGPSGAKSRPEQDRTDPEEFNPFRGSPIEPLDNTLQLSAPGNAASAVSKGNSADGGETGSGWQNVPISDDVWKSRP